MKTKRIALDAMLIAMYFLLSNYFSLNLGNIRISIDVFPIIIGAALIGPVDGLIIGLLGNFLFQLAGPYGLSVTTVLWMLPDGLRGLLAGLLLNDAANASLSRRTAVLCLISLAAATLTTGVMYIDCLVFKYAFVTYTPLIIWRYVVGLLIAVLCAFILPPLTRAIKQYYGKKGGNA
jgi:ECF transporter S component (folate family)